MATKTTLEQRIEYLESELEKTTAQRNGLQRANNELQNSVELLRGEVEMLSAWRERELQRLRYEAATDALRRGLAQSGVDTSIDADD